MDDAQISLPLAVPIDPDSPQLMEPVLNVDTTPSRQSRLLQSRNARFSAKRLSVSKIGSKIAQRTKSDVAKSEQITMRNNENTPLVSHSDRQGMKRILSSKSYGKQQSSAKRNSSGILSPKCGNSTPPEQVEKRKTLQKRHSSPLVYQNSPTNQRSPANSAVSSDSSRSMRLREVSGNESRGSQYVDSPRKEFLHRVRKQKSMQLKAQIDAENYIEHIENELLQAKEALHSPTSHKSLHTQLKSARTENDRLKRELTEMRNAFETEVKSTLEHQASAEAELKRRVKLLEDELLDKESTIQNLEYQHEEKRLDSNTLDTLKATIERLEAEKLSIEEENRSMTKRNEVLSELLAMSPTKTRFPFEPRSPVREKRPGRPMSLIIPRLPSSPTAAPVQSCITSSKASSPLISTSKSPSLAAEILPLSLDGELQNELYSSQALNRFNRYRVDRANSKSSSVSISDSSSSPVVEPVQCPPQSSPVHGSSSKTVFKRKPRKFMHGSTQLKPLLLPTLRADTSSQNSASVLGSPGSMYSADQYPDTWEGDSYFGLDPSHLSFEKRDDIGTSAASPRSTPKVNDHHGQYQTVDEILAEHSSRDHLQQDSSDDEVRLQAFKVHDHGLTGPGPTITSTQSTPSKVDNIQHQSYSHQIETQKNLHFAESRRSFIESEQNTSVLFDVEALKRLKLPPADFESFSSDAYINGIRSVSAVPAPLFSPVSRGMKTEDFFPTMKCDLDRLAELSHRKRRQSRSTIHDGIVSPTPKTFQAPASQSTTNLSYVNLADDREDKFNRTKSPAAMAASLSRSITPLEILNRRQFGARPLAAFTIRTICTALSRCTTFVRDVKSDPLTLARRVLANAWFANWKRFGRMSWWVLGLFLPQRISKTLPQWDWDDFDGEMIAQRCCEETSEELDLCHNSQALTPITSDVTAGVASITVPDSEPRTGWCKSIFLWGKFSIAMMLAVGGAVVKGPADMLRDIDHNQPLRACHRHCTQCNACAGNHMLRANNAATSSHGIDKIDSRKYFIYKSTDAPDKPMIVLSKKHEHGFQSLSSPPTFSFRSPAQLSGLPHLGFDYSPTDDRTLRPNKTRKKHVVNVFQQPQPNISADSDNNLDTWSQDTSHDDGVLKWPPDLDLDGP